MPFSFSFTLTIPGLSNPFSAAGQSSSAPPESESSLYVDDSKQRPAVPPHRRAPSPSLLPPLSRKRGWVPSNSELSHATAVPTLTNGYLDTPGKYRDMITASNAEEDIEEMVAGGSPVSLGPYLSVAVACFAIHFPVLSRVNAFLLDMPPTRVVLDCVSQL